MSKLKGKHVKCSLSATQPKHLSKGINLELYNIQGPHNRSDVVEGHRKRKILTPQYRKFRKQLKYHHNVRWVSWIQRRRERRLDYHKVVCPIGRQNFLSFPPRALNSTVISQNCANSWMDNINVEPTYWWLKWTPKTNLRILTEHEIQRHQNWKYYKKTIIVSSFHNWAPHKKFTEETQITLFT